MINNIVDAIGNTPIVSINNFTTENDAKIYVKLEGGNPAGSIKDRVALAMIDDAQRRGILKEGMSIIEPTSGNTGIALALVGMLRGYKVSLVMPNTMSAERISLMKAYGAEVILTDGKEGMKGSIKLAEHMSKEYGMFMPSQFDNPINTRIHYETTGVEIINDIPDIDVFVAGVGTGGTISGVGRRLKEYNKDVYVVSVEPKNSAVLSGSVAGVHKIQGIGAGFIPSIYDGNVVDEIITVDDEKSMEFASEISRKEGLMLGISSSANILVALQMAKRFGKGKKVLTISPDGGYKYISSGIFG